MKERKEYGLHFRYRALGIIGPEDVGLVCLAHSQAEAKRIGKNMERPHDKVWFMGLIPVESAKATGGNLP